MICDELKPCPFCGERKIEKYISVQFGGSVDSERVKDYFKAVCSRCGCRTATFGSWTSAVIAWNRRANNEL